MSQPIPTAFVKDSLGKSLGFFAPVAIPATDFCFVLRDPYNWGRTQVVTSNGADVYEPGGGYDASSGGDLKFTIKTRD